MPGEGNGNPLVLPGKSHGQRSLVGRRNGEFNGDRVYLQDESSFGDGRWEWLYNNVNVLSDIELCALKWFRW